MRGKLFWRIQMKRDHRSTASRLENVRFHRRRRIRKRNDDDRREMVVVVGRNRRRGFWRWISVFLIEIFYNSWILRWSLMTRRPIHFRMILNGWQSQKLSIRIYQRHSNKMTSPLKTISKRTVPVYLPLIVVKSTRI